MRPARLVTVHNLITMRNAMNKRSIQGFTLIEILIAVAIFAVLAVVSFGSLNSVLRSREHIDAANKKLHQLQLGMTIMQRDFTQLIDASITNEFGDIGYPIIFSKDESESNRLIEFTRSGWSNPADSLRSTLQRVAYTLEEKTLYREYWHRLNRGPDDLPVRSALLEGIDNIEFEFEDAGQNWHERWPPLTASSNYVGLPQTIRVTLYYEDEREVIRLFDLPQ